MSHELLVIAGLPDDQARQERAGRVNHAARFVPGQHKLDFAETPYAALAVVETSPAGGTSAALLREGDRVRAAVATSTLGLDIASADAADNHLAGSEAGHVVVVAGPDGSVEVRGDGLAFLQLYWAEIQGTLYLSTHLASLVSLGVPADHDAQGIFEYLAMLHQLQQRTLLRHASLLPAGGSLDWRPGSPARVSATPLFAPSPDTMNDDDALAEFRELWPQVIGGALDRSKAERVTIGLSGGLDSRAIAVTAKELGAEVTSYTYGSTRNREVRTAIEVASRLGIGHLTLPVTDDTLLRHATDTIARIDGSHSAAELYDTWFSDTVRGFGDVMINGHAGGPVWGDEKALGLTDRDTITDRVWGRYAPAAAYLLPFLREDLQADFQPAVRTGIHRSLQPWDFHARADMITFWQVANRQTRWGNTLVGSTRRSGLRIEAPFLDSRFLQFARRMDASQRRNGRFYLRVHREVFGQTADIGRSDDGNSPNRLSHLYWTGDESFLRQWVAMTTDHPVSGLRRGARRASAKAAAILRSKTGIRRPADWLDEQGSVFPADLWLRTRPVYAERLAALIGSAASSSGGVLDEEAVSAAAGSVAAGTAPAPALILARLANLGGWLDDYAQRQARDPRQ